MGQCSSNCFHAWWLVAHQILRSISFVLLAAVVLLPNPARAQTSAEAVMVPYTVTPDGLFMVDAMVNGKGPFPFLIDTGASVSALAIHLHRALYAEEAVNPSTRVFGVAESGLFPRVALESLSVGTITQATLEAVVLPFSETGQDWDGILGLNFLAGRLIQFDSKEKFITIMQASPQNTDRFSDWRRLRAYRDEEIEGSFPFIFFRVGIDSRLKRHRIEALLDLGSTFPIINWNGARELGHDTTYRRLRRDWEIEGAVGSFEPKALIMNQTIRVSRKRWNTPLLISDTTPLELLNRTDKPFVLFSAGFFKDMDFAIDFETPEVYFNPD